MNIEHLRKSLRAQWLTYYRENRSWLTHLGVWVTCEGERRPSSSFILGTLSTLEPQLIQLLPLIVDLSSNPDRIVIALGLNFNPDDELESFEEAEQLIANGHTTSVRMLPEGNTVEVAVQRMTEREPEVKDSSPEAEVNPFGALPETVVPAAQMKQSPEAQPQSSQTRSNPTKQAPVRKSDRSQPPTPKPQPAPTVATTPPTTPTIAPADKAPLVNPRSKQTPNPDDTLADRPVQSVTSSPSMFEQRFAVVRPVMDSVQLSAGELPKREVEESDNTDLDERTRHSDR